MPHDQLVNIIFMRSNFLPLKYDRFNSKNGTSCLLFLLYPLNNLPCMRDTSSSGFGTNFQLNFRIGNNISLVCETGHLHILLSNLLIIFKRSSLRRFNKRPAFETIPSLHYILAFCLTCTFYANCFFPPFSLTLNMDQLLILQCIELILCILF